MKIILPLLVVLTLLPIIDGSSIATKIPQILQ